MSARNILITGASSGIGLASAVTLKTRGWRVFATARKPVDLERLAGLGIEALPLELADPASITRLADTVLERTGGRLDALFNNAACAQPGAVEDLTPDLLRRQFEVNFFGWHDLTRRLIPAMRANGGGRIVQCSSVLGLVSPPFRGAYNATKFAVEALSDALRFELAGTGIHVSIIEPGPIETNFVATALANLRDNIAIETSPHRDKYRRRLAAMAAGGKQTFKLPPEAVALKLVHAVESTRPKVRYYVTVPTYLAAYGRRFLPRRTADWLTARF